jgi:TonB family protein
MAASRRNLSLTVALCASLTAHALIVLWAARQYVAEIGGHIMLPGFRLTLLGSPLLPEEPRNRLGDEDGKGTAMLSTPGELPLLAPKASQDQPFLSLDPVGAGEVGVKPTESTAPPDDGSGDSPAAPMPAQPIAPPPAVFAAPANADPAPTGVKDPIESLGGPFVRKPRGDVEQETPLETSSAVAMAAILPPAQNADPNPLNKSGARSSADPAPLADSESDPTGVIGSATFRPGATDVQIGRKSRLTRPRLSLAAKADLTTERTRSLVLRLKLDETGKVTSAEVYRSSGSIAVDQPCQIAAYSWWFEPLKNSEGTPVKDVILFTIRFI